MKLDSLERRLMELKTNGTIWHRLLVRLINSFSFGLEEAWENLEIENLGVLCWLGADESSEDAVIAVSNDYAPNDDLTWAVKLSRNS